MDLIEKINTLLNATINAKLPHWERRSALEQLEQEQLAAIRRALAEVEIRERDMAERLKTEQVQAEEAAQRGNPDEQRAHERPRQHHLGDALKIEQERDDRHPVHQVAQTQGDRIGPAELAQRGRPDVKAELAGEQECRDRVAQNACDHGVLESVPEVVHADDRACRQEHDQNVQPAEQLELAGVLLIEQEHGHFLAVRRGT